MVGVLLVGVLLAVLNQTLLSPALPAIMNDLAVDATTVQWLTSGYSLVEAVVIPLSAYLIGRFSTRQLFISAFALFTAGSLAAAIAPNFWVLLLGRVLQAACTGMSMPMVFTVILLVFPREKRGTAMGVIGLIIGFAPAVGPSVAGLLVDSVGWRALFGVVTALSVVVIVLAVAVLKNYGDFARAPFDKLSVVLCTVGLVCLLYGLSTFASTDNMIVTVALMVAGLVLCLLYVRRQLKLPEPMLQVGILGTRKY
ncbi:MFS transporter, partial [Adlercreutzia caecimuris]